MLADSFLVMTVTESFGTAKRLPRLEQARMFNGKGRSVTGRGTVKRARRRRSALGLLSALSLLLLDLSLRLLRHAAAGRRAHRVRTAERDLLDRLEVDERHVVVDDRSQFGRARRSELALRLEHEERR